MVIFKGKCFCFTRLNFGENVVPLITKSTVSVITQARVIKSAMLGYVDDIFINENLLFAACMLQFFLDNSLVCKIQSSWEMELRSSACKSREKNSTYQWKKASQVLEVPNMVTCQCIFSLSEKLVGYFPVYCLFRVATTFIKRRASMVTKR